MHISQNNNLNRKNQVILLMITDGKKWHFLAVKSLSALFKSLSNCCYSFRTENRLKNIKKCVKNMVIAM